jgi:hypothetical protein
VKVRSATEWGEIGWIFKGKEGRRDIGWWRKKTRWMRKRVMDGWMEWMRREIWREGGREGPRHVGETGGLFLYLFVLFFVCAV